MPTDPADVDGATFLERGEQRCAGPAQRDIRTEWQALIEPSRLFLATPWLARTPKSDGAPVITYPGSATNDTSMAPLRAYLRSRGYDARGWGLGTNNRSVIDSIDLSVEPLLELAEEAGRPVRLVGWSLGGVIARELARDHPDLVERVVTMATPLYGPRFTVAFDRYGSNPERLAAIDEAINTRSDRQISVPVLAFYSRNDGIVDWRACVDHENESTTNVEVKSSHAGMGIDPEVWRRMAQFLAE